MHKKSTLPQPYATQTTAARISVKKARQIAVHSPVSTKNFSPEKKLMLGMLVLTIQDLKLETKYKPLKKFFILPQSKYVEKEHVINALDFIADTENPNYLYSFDNICIHLNLFPKELKTKLLNQTKENKKTKNIYKKWENRNAARKIKRKRK